MNILLGKFKERGIFDEGLSDTHKNIFIKGYHGTRCANYVD